MNILIGYDGTASADHAVQYALHTFSAHQDVKVHILYVESIPYVNGEFGVLPVPYDITINHEISNHADALFKDSHITPTLQSEIGVPGEVIVDFAEKIKADLVVLGAHNKGALERLLLGSVSESVTRRAPCSVLLVR